MKNMLETLTKVAPPPANPIETGSEDGWLAAEAELGLALPDDYKDLIRTYGTGSWERTELFILSPFNPDFGYNLVRQCFKTEGDNYTILDAERAAKKFLTEEGCEPYPHPIYPEPGGIIPWATNGNGGRMFWLTDGPAESWRTAYHEDKTESFRLLDLTTTEILLSLTNGTIELYPDMEPADPGEPHAMKITHGFTPLSR